MVRDPYMFDLDFFRAELPSSPAAGDRVRLSYMCSPSSLLDVERIRDALSVELENREHFPCDVFTWALGDPPDRDATRLGGVPYRPSTSPWPLDKAGEPLAFLGQVRFVESRDIVGETPGDLLLIFVEGGENYCGDWTGDSFVLEWQPLGLHHLVAAQDVPTTALQVPRWYGVRHRTYDVETPLDLTSLGSTFPNWKSKSEKPEIEGRNLARLQMAKIGGLLPFDWRPELPLETPVALLVPALYPAIAGAYPFVNRPGRLTGDEVYEQMFAPGMVAFSFALLRKDLIRPKVHVILDFE